VALGNPIADANGNPIADSSGNPRADNCCCCAVYGVLTCPDLTATALYVMSPAPQFFKVGEVCYVRGDCAEEVPTEGAVVEPGDVFESCDDCVVPPSYLCAPNEDEAYTDEELAAMYPDLRATIWGVRWCPCFEFTADDGINDNGVSYKIVNEGINGATFLLSPGALYHVDHGHCRNYTYSMAPAGFQTLTETHFGHFATDCSATEEGWKTGNYANDSLGITATLCCKLDVGVDPPVAGWSYTYEVDWIANYGGLIAGGSGIWGGGGGHLNTASNSYNFDGDCIQSVGPPDQNPIGGGQATLFAVPPGI
jgi:hypothetical protein